MRFFAGTSLAVAAVAAAVVSSAPVPSDARLADPPFTQAQDALDGALACPLQPNRSYKNVSKPVLFVPGAGMSGPIAWDDTYVPLTPGAVYPGANFQPCYVTLPSNTLADLQVAAEYVVNAVKRLQEASGKPVPVTAHSAGNVAIQWALTFYPSTRKSIDRFIAFAPPFKGANLPALVGAIKPFLPPAVWQLQSTSRFLKALKNAGGDKAFIPTTTIYSSDDEIVPEPAGTAASSYLKGASNIRLQVPCDLKYTQSHFQHLWAQADFAAWQSALRSESKVATKYSFGGIDCSNRVPLALPIQDQLFVNFIPGKAIANIAAGTLPPLGVREEPPLASYAAKFA